MTAPSLASAGRAHRHLVDAAKAILIRTPEAPHRLDDLAATLGVSTSHLAHVFRAEVGLGLHQYLLQVRMTLALGRLSGRGSELSRLAMDLGFATHSHFSAVFRQYYGLPPSRVRDLLRAPQSERTTRNT